MKSLLLEISTFPRTVLYRNIYRKSSIIQNGTLIAYANVSLQTLISITHHILQYYLPRIYCVVAVLLNSDAFAGLWDACIIGHI
jgi:hypothetical protein